MKPASRLAGYEDINDADRLRHDPVLRRLVGRCARRGVGLHGPVRGRDAHSARSSSLTLLRERLVKPGARMGRHARYAVCQFAEAARLRAVFAGVLGLITGLREPPVAVAPA